MFGESEKWRLQITSNKNGAGITVFDQNGKCIKTLTLSAIDKIEE